MLQNPPKIKIKEATRDGQEREMMLSSHNSERRVPRRRTHGAIDRTLRKSRHQRQREKTRTVSLPFSSIFVRLGVNVNVKKNTQYILFDSFVFFFVLKGAKQKERKGRRKKKKSEKHTQKEKE